MATKKTPTTKTTKKAASKAPAKKKAATETTKPRADKPARVFAIRVTDDELAAIHRASGPRNATRFIRAVAAAFANEDEAAFRAVIKEAKDARTAS